MKHTKWNKIYMNMALELAKGSKDTKLKVGCIVVSQDRKMILSSGVNGGPIGGRNKRKSKRTGCSGFIHAEINTLYGKSNFDITKHKDLILYVTHKPCTECAKYIQLYNSFSHVYFCKPYLSRASEILKNSGIKIERLR